MRSLFPEATGFLKLHHSCRRPTKSTMSSRTSRTHTHTRQRRDRPRLHSTGRRVPLFSAQIQKLPLLLLPPPSQIPTASPVSRSRRTGRKTRTFMQKTENDAPLTRIIKRPLDCLNHRRRSGINLDLIRTKHVGCRGNFTTFTAELEEAPSLHLRSLHLGEFP